VVELAVAAAAAAADDVEEAQEQEQKSGTYVSAARRRSLQVMKLSYSPMRCDIPGSCSSDWGDTPVLEPEPEKERYIRLNAETSTSGTCNLGVSTAAVADPARSSYDVSALGDDDARSHRFRHWRQYDSNRPYIQSISTRPLRARCTDMADHDTVLAPHCDSAPRRC